MIPPFVVDPTLIDTGTVLPPVLAVVALVASVALTILTLAI